MKVLITGSAGFVGRHFVRALDDHELTLVDVNEHQPMEVRQFFRIMRTRFDLVVHLAAVVGGRATIEGEPLSVAVDLAIDADLFRWALLTRPRRIIYYSSSAAYPTLLQQGSPFKLREQDIDLSARTVGMPDLTYGWAKLTGEYLAQFVEAEGVRVHIFRPFSGYGEDQDLSYPFPSFIDRARRRENPFVVWGDGTQVRDWIHISDVVNGTLAAVREDVPGPLNLCTGRATSFRQLAELVTKKAGYSPQVEYLTEKPRGVSYRVGNPERFFAVYRPRIELETGISLALA